MTRLRAPSALAVAAALFGAACGDDPAPSTDTTLPDVAGDMSEPDADDPDTTAEDIAGDTTDDTPPACENPCVTPQGTNDRRLCPAPVSEWLCVDGCCEAAFRCADDDDCRAEGYTNGQCPDGRFDCRCDVPTGVCANWLCATDDECDEGAFCVGGTCVDDDEGTLSLRLVTPDHIVLPVGGSHTVRVDGTREVGGQLLARPVTATFGTAADAVATVDTNGVVTAAGEGQTIISATVEGSAPVAVTVDVIAVDPGDALTVIALTEKTREPVAGTYAVVDGAGTTLEIDDIPADGVIRFADEAAGPFDLHIFADAHDWVSWRGLAKGAVLSLPMAPSAYGRVQMDIDGNIIAEETTLDHVGLIRGTPDFGDYSYEGTLEIVITSVGLSNALFDFSLPVLLGSDVKRFLDQDSQIPRVDKSEPIDVPGGIVLGLLGPAIADFVLTAPKGETNLWTLGGKLDLNDIAEYSGRIFDALDGGRLDFTQIVGAVFPLFRGFWSGYTPGVEVTTVGDPTAVVSQNPVLTTPMSMATLIDVPALPAIGELGYADALFLLGGAQTADGAMIPLGLNGGADTADKELNPPDGIADGDERTPEKDPFSLPIAALHSGLQGPHTRYMTVSVAVSIPAGGGDPRPSAGSATLTRFDAGERPPVELSQPEFLPFPAAATFDPAIRTVNWSAVAGADLERVLVKGKRGRHWTVYGGAGEATFPDPADFGITEDRLVLEDMESLLVNAIDFDSGVDAGTIGQRSGVPFELLLTVVERVSFLDIKNARPATPAE